MPRRRAPPSTHSACRTRRTTPMAEWIPAGCRSPTSRRADPLPSPMPKRTTADATTVAIRLDHVDGPNAMASIAAAVAGAGGRLRTMATVRRIPASTAVKEPIAEVELEVEGLTEETLVAVLGALEVVTTVRLTRALERIIVIGGGAQVAQVALGAVSEADRHNLRGERISVDTIALVGEAEIAAAVRAVADLPRARFLVLAGSIMGGDISNAADELRAVGVPIIALNMVGSITDHVDLVVSDPVQAGTMAVMAIANTASFDLVRQKGRRY